MNNIQYTVKIHAPDIEAKYRHERILLEFDHLRVGEFMKLTNDHDPRPLRYQFLMERGGDTFSWRYFEEGPDLWHVAIGKK